jgi:hypothetical protein
MAVAGLAAAVVTLALVCAYLCRHVLGLRRVNREKDESLQILREALAQMCTSNQKPAARPRRLDISGKLPVQRVICGRTVYHFPLN